MANQTGISWTDRTWNPTTGCDQTSPGCDNCYALAQAARLKGWGQPAYQRDGDPRTSGPGFGLTLHPDRLAEPYRWRKPSMVFVNSMSDVFHPEVPDEFIRSIWEVMAENPTHTFQVLTKRSKRLAELADKLPWPANVWQGVSVESDRYTFRVDHLRSVPAAVRFVSAEPLLTGLPSLKLDGIGWLIAGCESGRGARSMDDEWVRDLRDRCVPAGVAFYFKQRLVGGRKIETPELDGRTWQQYPYTAPQARSHQGAEL